MTSRADVNRAIVVTGMANVTEVVTSTANVTNSVKVTVWSLLHTLSDDSLTVEYC